MPDDNLFWQYSLCLYQAQGVEQYCLEWQNRHGANVNLVLFCCWAGCQGLALSQNQLREFEVLIAGWDQQVVQPLRNVRQALKQQQTDDALRQQVFDAELTAEKVVQDKLYQWWRELPRTTAVDKEPVLADLQRDNLNAYLQLLGIKSVDVSHSLVQAAGSVNMQHLQP